MATDSTSTARSTERATDRSAGLLTGRTVLVTGAGQGLGRAYALHAAAHGARAAVNDIDAGAVAAVCAEIVSAGGDALAVAGSVSEWAEAVDVVERAASCGLHGVVCNAGVFDVGDPWSTTPDQVARMVAVNVVGTIACATRAMQLMPPGGSIVTVVSGAAAGMSGMSVYGATKGAVASLTASWAIDLAARGIRVNAVSPVAETRLTDIGRLRLGPTPRQPAPARAAPLVTYLLSPAADGVTGHLFRIDAMGLGILGSLTPTRTWPCADDPDVATVATAVDALVAGG